MANTVAEQSAVLITQPPQHSAPGNSRPISDDGGSYTLNLQVPLLHPAGIGNLAAPAAPTPSLIRTTLLALLHAMPLPRAWARPKPPHSPRHEAQGGLRAAYRGRGGSPPPPTPSTERDHTHVASAPVVHCTPSARLCRLWLQPTYRPSVVQLHLHHVPQPVVGELCQDAHQGSTQHERDPPDPAGGELLVGCARWKGWGGGSR
jgi:hypothetical protein